MSVTNVRNVGTDRSFIDRRNRGGNPSIDWLLGGIGLADARQIFGRNLGYWLKERGLSGSELARRLTNAGHETSQSSVSKWLHAKHGPDFETLGAVAEILEVPIFTLFAADDDRPAPGRPPPRKPDALEQALKVIAASAGIEISVRPKRRS